MNSAFEYFILDKFNLFFYPFKSILKIQFQFFSKIIIKQQKRIVAIAAISKTHSCFDWSNFDGQLIPNKCFNFQKTQSVTFNWDCKIYIWPRIPR